MHIYLFLYLFIYASFNNAVSSSDNNVESVDDKLIREVEKMLRVSVKENQENICCITGLVRDVSPGLAKQIVIPS